MEECEPFKRFATDFQHNDPNLLAKTEAFQNSLQEVNQNGFTNLLNRTGFTDDESEVNDL